MAFLALFTSEFFMTTAWRWLINLFYSFIGNYGWCIVVFTICLKLLLSPLDFFNRKKSYDNKRVMRRMKPEMERLDKQYADNPQQLMLKKRELQKKYGYGMGATCLTSILTLFIFITLWTGMQTISKEMNIAAYEDLQTTYHSSQEQYMNKDALDKLSISDLHDEFWAYYSANYIGSEDYNEQVSAYVDSYKESHDGKDPSEEDKQAHIDAHVAEWTAAYFNKTEAFAFDPSLTDADYYESIKITPAQDDEGNTINIYESKDDEHAAVFKQANLIAHYGVRGAIIARYDEIKESWLWVKNIWRADTWQNPILSHADYKALTGTNIDSTTYDDIMAPLQEQYHKQWNGYLILVVLTIGLNVLNQWLMMRMQKQSGETDMVAGSASTMKIMMIVMPIMLGVFAFQYASAFTLYMVTNAAMTLLLFGVSALILSAREKKLDAEEAAGIVRTKKVRHGRSVKKASEPTYGATASYARPNRSIRTPKDNGDKKKK